MVLAARGNLIAADDSQRPFSALKQDCRHFDWLRDQLSMTTQTTKSLPIRTAERRPRPSHPGRVRRLLGRFSGTPPALTDRLESFAALLQKAVNTVRFEDFWRERVYSDPRTIIVPTFSKTSPKHSIWNIAIQWIDEVGPTGTMLEFGTNNGGSLHYFASRLPATMKFVGFDCFEGIPEAWDGLPAGAIKGYGLPIELWSDDPELKKQVLADFERTGRFPAPPQPNVRVEAGLFSEALTRYLKDGWPHDLRLVHMDADIYISTRPVLDTLCGPLRHRYLILFDEFYSVNHEFRAWREFTALFDLRDWRVVAASEDAAQVLIEVNGNSAAPASSGVKAG